MQLKTLAWIFVIASGMLLANEQNIEPVLQLGLNRLTTNAKAQQSIDAIHSQAQQLEQDYRQELKIVQSLERYNFMLQKQLAHQESQIEKLTLSINNTTLIERQIMPLLERMLDTLELFILADIPFLAQERQQRLHGLRTLLELPEFTTAEKARRVFEAYQIENEFGYTLEAYKGNLDLNGERFAVDFLRIGRVALLYQDLSGHRAGYWDRSSSSWHPLTEQQYLRHIRKGLKIAHEEISPELITIPLALHKEIRP